jgi:hypothetical protein
MIPRIQWPENASENDSPFIIGGIERPLRLTVHTDPGLDYTDEEAQAIELIYELCSEKEIDVLDFDGRRVPKVELSSKSSNDSHVHLKVITPSGDIVSHHIGILTSNISNQSVQLRFDLHDKSDPNFQTALNHLIAIEAHSALDRDIFVTNSKYLIGSRDDVERGNPRTPLEACRIMGLCMRSRDNWTYIRSPKLIVTTDIGMVYWKVMRSRLPSMWKYFSILLRASSDQGDEMSRIGQSILEKCSRSLQARDEIGKNFYLPQGNNTRDIMMYHFDYLTLLVAGVYDSLAVIANRVYSLIKQEHLVGFRRLKFRKALSLSDANDLNKFVLSSRVELLEMMLHNLRNTIHSAGLGTYAYVDQGAQESYAKLPPAFRDGIWEAAIEISSAMDWGLIKDEFVQVNRTTGDRVPSYEIAFEPYSYADALLRHWFPIIDEIASLTDVDRLYRGSQENVLNRLPDDWKEDVRRFELLVG